MPDNVYRWKKKKNESSKSTFIKYTQLFNIAIYAECNTLLSHCYDALERDYAFIIITKSSKIIYTASVFSASLSDGECDMIEIILCRNYIIIAIYCIGNPKQYKISAINQFPQDIGDW